MTSAQEKNQWRDEQRLMQGVVHRIAESYVLLKRSVENESSVDGSQSDGSAPVGNTEEIVKSPQEN